ncbi:unnamed protein product, partial [Mesorhabditis belari]|uniref:Uncharacterized protein n=1 Tax=Mesorhabditis belari TaxID=2138241 RepID=A0AAF3EZL4_9BILA
MRLTVLLLLVQIDIISSYRYQRNRNVLDDGIICTKSLSCGERQRVYFEQMRQSVPQIEALKRLEMIRLKDRDVLQLLQLREELCENDLALGFIFKNWTGDDRAYCVWSGGGWRSTCVLGPENLSSTFPSSIAHSIDDDASIDVVLPFAWTRLIRDAKNRLGCSGYNKRLEKEYRPKQMEIFVCSKRCISLGIDPFIAPFMWLLTLLTFMLMLSNPQWAGRALEQHEEIVHI